jgi:hypothetical protein
MHLNCTAVPVRTVGILRSSIRTILESRFESPRGEDWRLLHFLVAFQRILSANIFLSQLDQCLPVVLHERFDSVAYCTETSDELDGKGSVPISQDLRRTFAWAKSKIFLRRYVPRTQDARSPMDAPHFDLQSESSSSRSGLPPSCFVDVTDPPLSIPEN